jgi:hypothetical protein
MSQISGVSNALGEADRMHMNKRKEAMYGKSLAYGCFFKALRSSGKLKARWISTAGLNASTKK